MKLLMNWWANNTWRWWQIRWAWANEPYVAVEIWQEYRHMLDPADDRDLVELILDEYERDVDQALCNPIVKAVIWMRRIING